MNNLNWLCEVQDIGNRYTVVKQSIFKGDLVDAKKEFREKYSRFIEDPRYRIVMSCFVELVKNGKTKN